MKPHDTGPTRTRRSPEAANLPGLLNLRLRETYQGPVPTQARFQGRKREAARLANLYCQTGRELHKDALERHMSGTLMRLKEIEP